MGESRLRMLLDFVETRAPGTLATYPPVLRSQIDDLFGACPREVVAALPRAALEVLSWLGGSDSNAVSVFGARYTTSIAQMLDDPEFQVLADRFFRVAIDRNPEQMTQDDLYIDLTRSNGEDAPLISLPEEWTGREPHPRGHTILSKALERLFYDFDLGRRGFVGYLAEGYHPTKGDVRWEDYADAMTRLVQRMGLSELIEIRPDVCCYSTPEVALMFEAMGVDLRTPDGYIQVWIGAHDRDAFLNYAAQIRTAMPPLPILDEWRLPRQPNSPI